MFKVLKNKIVAMVKTSALIQEAFDYEVEEFSGDPACTITASENSGDYNTTDENVKIYSFYIRVYVNRDTRAKKKADEVLTEVVDDLMNIFDKDYTMSGIIAPTGYTFINSFALPSRWGYAGREDIYRVAEMQIRCRVSVDLNAI